MLSVGRCGVARLQMKVGHMDGMHCFIDSTSILLKVKPVSLYNSRTVYRAEGVSDYRCSNCEKPDHSSKKCYSRRKGEARVNPVVASGFGAVSQVTCFGCGGTCHIARICRKPPRRKGSDDNRRMLGNEVRRPENSRPTVSSIP